MALQPITVKLSEKELSFVKWTVDNDLAINRSEAIRKLIQTEMKNADKDRGSQWVAEAQTTGQARKPGGRPF